MVKVNRQPLRYAWATPPDLAEAVAAGTTVDVVYVHLPFASELEANAGTHGHDALIAHLIAGLDAHLARSGKPFGIQPWPVDDIVVWLGDWNDDERATHWLTDKLESLLGDLDLPTPVKDRTGEISLARQRMPAIGQADPLRPFARVLGAAQRGACDPVARERQRSTELMEQALRERAFVFHYQPIVDVIGGNVIAHEALCRGTLDALRFPDVIFGAAERTQKVWDLGRVLRDLIAGSLDQFEQDRGARDGPLMFLNVHPSDIDDPVFLEQALSGALRRHASRVVIELTERAAIRDYRRVKAFFQTLRRHGYRLAIDDLGSGYAGLTALAELEPDFIKFDMGLVRDLHLHPIKQRLIERMHGFAVEIGAQTISEGVEVEEERDALLESGCTVMQGYFFGRPAPKFVDVPTERYPNRMPAIAAPPPRSAVS